MFHAHEPMNHQHVVYCIGINAILFTFIFSLSHTFHNINVAFESNPFSHLVPNTTMGGTCIIMKIVIVHWERNTCKNNSLKPNKKNAFK